MDVRLSPEQRALRESAALVVDRLGPSTVADLDDHERMAKLDAAVEATGWRELRAAADDDRAPLATGVEVALVAEELGRGLADTPLLGPTLAAELRRRAGAPAAAGRETVALAADLQELATAVDGAVAVDALGAKGAVLLAPSPSGFSLGRVVLGTVTADGADLTSRLTPVGPATVEGEPGELTAEDVSAVVALGLAVTSADLVGVMSGAVTLAAEYAKERRQYGVAIGSFQAVQHLLADALVATEGSRSAALHAAWAVDALPADEALAAGALAKAYCARAARQVCETAIQVHGGIGNTWECLAHVFLRRALLSSDLFGGVGPSLERVLASKGIGKGPGTEGGGSDGVR
jgi:hypothetical protein